MVDFTKESQETIKQDKKTTSKQDKKTTSDFPWLFLLKNYCIINHHLKRSSVMAYLKKQIDAYAAGFFQLDSHMLSNGEYFCFSSSNYRRLRHLKMLYEVSNLYFSKGDYLEFVIKPFGVEIRVEENLDQRSKRLLFCFKASGYSLWARPYEENIEISTE